MGGLAKTLGMVAGALAATPVAWKLGCWIRDTIFKKAQNPDDIINEEACKAVGYHWYKPSWGGPKKCHVNPAPEKVEIWRCPKCSLEFPSYETLIEHFEAEHPEEAIRPPPTPTPIIRPIETPGGG